MGCDLLWNTLTYALYSCAINTPFSSLPGKCQFIQVQPSILILCENNYENSTTLPITSTPFPVTTSKYIASTTTTAQTTLPSSTTLQSTSLPRSSTGFLTTNQPTTLPSTTTAIKTTVPSHTSPVTTSLFSTTTEEQATTTTKTTLLPATTTPTTLPATTTVKLTTPNTETTRTTTLRPTSPKTTVMPTFKQSTTEVPTTMIVKKEYVVDSRLEKKDDIALVLSIIFGSLLFLVLSGLLYWKRKDVIGTPLGCCKNKKPSKQAQVKVELTEREEIEKDLQNNKKTMINVQKALRQSKMKTNSVGVSQHPKAPSVKSVEKPPIPKRSLKREAIKGKNVRQFVAALERKK